MDSDTALDIVYGNLCWVTEYVKKDLLITSVSILAA